MNSSSESGDFENPRVHSQIVFDSIGKRIQRMLLSNLQRRFKLCSQDVEAMPVLENFDIEDPKDIESNQPIVEAGDVEVWIRISSEKTRRNLVRWIMWLYAVWVLVGLIVFVATGNVWLLVTMGVLALPLRKVLDYYF